MRKTIQHLAVVATLALVLITFTACSAPAGGSGASSYSAPAAPAAKSDGSSSAPAAPTTAPVQQSSSPDEPIQSPLVAGMIDDNANYSDYLKYAASHQGAYSALPMNLTDRRFVRVVDGKGQPVADASVSLSDGSRLVFSGRTSSDGRVAFFPHAADATQAQTLTVNVRRDDATASGRLDLGNGSGDTTTITITGSSEVSSLDIVFLLDSTGSMSDEIDRIKATIFTISQHVGQLPAAPPLRLGLVTYRDRGDDYITRSWDFSDVASFANNLNTVQAGGGGDTPEDFNAGLNDALNKLSWDADQRHALRLVFAVTDAAPHTDYSGETQYDALLKQAVGKGIKVFPIGASGLDDGGEYAYRQVAAYTLAKFVFLTYENGSSGAPGTATNLSVSQYSTANLDDLIVNLIAGEVANQQANFSKQGNTQTTYHSNAALDKPLNTEDATPDGETGATSNAVLDLILSVLRGTVAAGLSVLALLLLILLGQRLRRPATGRKQEKAAETATFEETTRIADLAASRNLIPNPDYWATGLSTASSRPALDSKRK